MKKYLFVSILTVMAPAVMASPYQNGLNDLSESNVVQASTDFSSAVAATPTDPDANFYYAMTRLLALPELPGAGGFLTEIGVPASGRDIYHWTAGLPRTASGKIKLLGSVNVDAYTAQIRTNILTALIAAQTNLAQISETNFTLALSNDVTHFGDITIDYGDVLMLRSLADTAEVFGYTLYSWNLNANIGSISNVIKTDHSLETVLTNFPEAFTFATTNDLAASRTAFSNAVELYLAASDFIRHRAPDSTFLFNIETNELASEAEFRGSLSNLLASLDGPPQPLSPNSPYKFSMAAFFSGTAPPRSWFPQLAPTGLAFEWNSWPDVTLGGLVTGLTETNLDKFAVKRLKASAEYTAPGWAVNVVAPIGGSTDGNASTAVSGADGTLYGTTPYGGNNGSGVVFKVAPNSSTATILYTFGSQSSDGSNPNGLIVGQDGNLYGTTQFGGLDGGGTLFKLSVSGKLTNLYQFGNSPYQANNPAAAMVQGTDGFLYGTTSGGGSSQSGTFFKASVTGSMQIFDSFSVPNVCGNVSEPLILGTDGNLYGVSDNGGTNGYGGVFEITTNGLFTQLYSFGAAQDPIFGAPLDGGEPNGPLLQASDGSFYGTTANGGTNDIDNFGDGTLFRITVAKGNVAFSNLVSFDSEQFDGYSPFGALVQDGQVIVGTTSSGGANQQGEIFEYALGNAPSALYWFDKYNVGIYQQFFAFFGGSSSPGGLSPGLNGAIYGTTSFDGSDNASGTVFKLSANEKPVISSTTSNTAAAVGATVALQVQASGPALTYQWYFDFKPATGAGVSGAATSTLSIKGIAAANAGSYDVIVKNSFGSATSSVFTVTVDVPPSYTKEPASLTVSPGGVAVFTATAINATSYQWIFNSTGLLDAGNISGSHSNVLTINPVSTLNAGNYQLVASSSFGSSNSTIVKLTVPLEKTKPVVAITSPAAGGRSNMFTFTGTASDSVRVEGVGYVINNLNDPGYVLTGPAVLSSGRTSSNWTFQPSGLLAAGTNILTVTASNYSGLTASASRTFFFLDAAPLGLFANPPQLGTVSGSPPSGGGPTPANGANLYIGQRYTVTAKPAAGVLLTNWTTNGVAASTNASFSFIMQNGLVAQANFVSNQFIRNAGRFDGIFSGDGETNSGLIGNLKVGTNGVYSGSLYLVGSTYSLQGAFNMSGQATEMVARPNASGSNVVLDMTVIFNEGPETITGSVRSKGWAVNNLTLVRAQTNAQTASYTMLFMSGPNGPNGPNNAVPGDGYAVITNKNGVLTLGGAMGDGSGFTQSTALGEDNQFPIYASLYSKGGSLLGRVNPLGVAAASVQWIKPPAASGAYSEGFSAEISAQGSLWSHAQGTYNSIVANEPDLAISGPGLANGLSAILEPGNTIKGADVGKFSFNAANGMVSIVFTNNVPKQVTGFGALLQNASFGGGYYLGTASDGTFTLGPP